MKLYGTGFDKLLRRLEGLEKSGARRAQRRAVRAGTAILLKAVKAATPVNEGVLKRMQASRVYGRGLNLAGVVGADADKLKQAEVSGKRPSNIDWLVENGHMTPGGTFVPPSGYMRRAADQAMPVAEAAYARVLAESIEAEASR
jgi:hypothetical protein